MDLARIVDCPRCRAPMDAADGVCIICGPPVELEVRPGFVAVDAGMEVCHACGAVAATHFTVCGTCGAPTGGSHEGVPPKGDGSYWVQLRTELTCVKCGQSTPVLPRGAQGASGMTVRCIPCGTWQTLEAEVWRDALVHAHAVGDLAAPDHGDRRLPPVARNPHADVGTTRAHAVHESRGIASVGRTIRTRNLRTVACPGHPLCDRCGSPLDVAHDDGLVVAQCPGCGNASKHQPLEHVSSLLGPSLLHVLADDLRVGAPEPASTESAPDADDPDALVFVCPCCDADLRVNDFDRMVTCHACESVCHVPNRAERAERPAVLRASPWWVRVRGTSSLRRLLIDEEVTGAPPSTPPPSPAGARRRVWTDRAQALRERIRPREEPRPLPRDPRREALAWALQVAVPLLMMGALALLWFQPTFEGWRAGRSSRETEIDALRTNGVMR